MTTGNDGARADVELTEQELLRLERAVSSPFLSVQEAVETIVAERLHQVEAERDLWGRRWNEVDTALDGNIARRKEAEAALAEALTERDEFKEASEERGAAAEKAQVALAEVRQREERVRALAVEWGGTVYKLPADHPTTVNEFCDHWFKRPLRKALGGDDA
jgi:chromosome segregation ATPase